MVAFSINDESYLCLLSRLAFQQILNMYIALLHKTFYQDHDFIFNLNINVVVEFHDIHRRRDNLSRDMTKPTK